MDALADGIPQAGAGRVQCVVEIEKSEMEHERVASRADTEDRMAGNRVEPEMW
jgi:hypothetical protein